MPSMCEQRPGMCAGDPACPDQHCPGYPRQACTTCCDGPCRAPQACQQPLQELPARIQRRLFTKRAPLRLPTTAHEWGRVAMTGTGIAGLFFILGALGRWKGWF